MHFDHNSCNISIGNEVLERIGNDCVNKYFKFLNWDFQNLIKTSSFFALSQIKNILPLNI